MTGAALPPPGAWRLAGRQNLRHAGWDGEYVVYNDLSGDTHLLEAGTMRVLLALRGGAHGEASLAAEYAPAGAHTAVSLPAILAELAQLGLIERCPC